MTPDIRDDDPSIFYNDSDYPSKDHGRFPENFDAITEQQGLAWDVDRYIEIAREHGAPVLEIGCGSGRIGIALARAGIAVWGVDISSRMLEHYKHKLEKEDDALNANITLNHGDAARLDLEKKDFPLAIIPFNTFLCINDLEKQRAALRSISEHLDADGLLVIDVMNPAKFQLFGSETPRLFFTRKNEWTGRSYSRFAAASPMDSEQRQRLFGWYDEIREDKTLERRPYSFYLRMVYRYELELMLEQSGFSVERIEGGHRGEPFNEHSGKMFVWARKKGVGENNLPL